MSSLCTVRMLHCGKFRNYSPFSSGERLVFVELQDAKLIKNEDFHKRDAAGVILISKEG